MRPAPSVGPLDPVAAISKRTRRMDHIEREIER